MSNHLGSTAVFDLEDMLDFVFNNYSTHFNGILGEIDTEKADSITLDTVDSGAFYFSLYEELHNHDPFMTFDIDVTGTQSASGCETAYEFTIMVQLHVADKNQGDMARRVLRYQKAMIKCAERIALDFPGLNRTEVSSLPTIWVFDEEGRSLNKQIINIEISGVLA